VCRAHYRNCSFNDALAPREPLALIQPNHSLSNARKIRIIQKLLQQLMNSPLKRAIFGAETIGLDFCL
jgi:hypothetical protein